MGMAVPPGGRPTNGAGWKAVGIVGGIILLGAVFGRGGSDRGSGSYGNSTMAVGDAPAASAAATRSVPYEEIASASVRRGSGHFVLATRDEGLSGARIYSENCYAALAREFSWARLDQCGAVDLRAAALAGGDTSSGAAHFAPETAASRYLQAATGAGAAAEVADRRLSSLQAMVAPRRAERPKVEAPPPEEDMLSEEDLADDAEAPGMEPPGNSGGAPPGGRTDVPEPPAG